jgi:transposase
MCTKEEQRAVIRFLFSEGVKLTKIFRRMKAQYGDTCLSQSKVYEWVERFKQGRTSVFDEERAGRSSTTTTQGHVYAVVRMIRENR